MGIVFVLVRPQDLETELTAWGSYWPSEFKGLPV